MQAPFLQFLIANDYQLHYSQKIHGLNLCKITNVIISYLGSDVSCGFAHVLRLMTVK